jgi:hypothetical protein
METAKPDSPYTPDAMAHIVTALFEKIHPLAIGAIEQSYALAKLIGAQCLATHMDPVTENEKINEIVDKLCDGYKSHSYEINRVEARKIGLNVLDAPSDLDEAMIELMKFYFSRRNGTLTSPPTKGQKFKTYIAWLDSIDLQMRVEADMYVVETDKIQSQGDRWVEY